MRESIKNGLVLASHNQGKLNEVRTMMEPYGIQVTSADEHGLNEPEETGDTFEKNAYIKAHETAKQTGLVALSDDSGLCVEALGGEPGVYTANWAEQPDGSRDFGVAMKLVEDKLNACGATTEKQRRAFFCAVLCLCEPNGHAEYFRGESHGTLVWPPRGDKGFGYDPVFMPDGHTRTFGEMEAAQKHGLENPLSHRARAFVLFAKNCLND